MSKYNRAFKLKLAKLAQYESSRELGRKFEVSSGQIRYWSLVFQIHGVESFRHHGHPYSSQFKLNAIKSMQAIGGLLLIAVLTLIYLLQVFYSNGDPFILVKVLYDSLHEKKAGLT